MADERKKGQDDQADTAPDEGTMTQHGRWTPEVSKAADRELRELAHESPGSEPATEGVDKSDLNLPEERRGGDH